MEEDIKPEVINEISIAAVIDSTPDVHHLNKIKLEFSLFETHLYSEFVEHAVVKHEDTSIQTLDLQIKSEVPDLKGDIKSGIEDIYIKHEPLVNEEFHINNEVERSLVDQTTKKTTQVKQFYCGPCNKTFSSNKKLQGHLNIHIEDKPFQCNMCNYKCIRKRYLEQHMKTHTGDKPLKCSECDYSCVWKSSLQHHNIKAHTDKKPFKCSLCNYGCIRAYDLQLHMKIHTPDKPFKCKVCDYEGRQKNNLERHMKIHTGEKPYRCYVCEYKCIQKSSLQRHMKTHTVATSF